MNSKIKKILAVLLSAVVVMSLAFISTAADPRYERPELNKADTVKTTGTWSKDANGFWSLTSNNTKVSGGWYYANMVNSSTEYRWYHFDEKGIMSAGWVKDRLDPSIWYYTGEAKDATEGSMATGWVTDPQDGQKYYMDPATGQMSHGWVKIDNAWYYFTESQYANRSWTPDQTGYWTASKQTGHSFGSMYKNEMTPDGYYVDGTGAWRQSSGNSSSRKKPTPTPTPVMAATASTTTPQHAGEEFNKEGLKITVFKNGVGEEVDYNDSRISNLSVTVVGTTDNKLLAGENKIEISFLYIDPDVIIGKSITTDVFTVEGKHTFTVKSDGTKVIFSPGLLYWDGSAFKFEENQYKFEGTWKEGHVNHFYWSKNASVAVAETYSDDDAEATDTFFTNNEDFEVNNNGVDETGWRTLSNDEWKYLIEGRTVNGGQGDGKSYKWATVNSDNTGVRGWILYPDDYTAQTGETSYTSEKWKSMENAGCVFLPAAGYRMGTGVNDVGDYGYYWSATTLESVEDYAYYLYFRDGDGFAITYSNWRGNGTCVRLVR